MAGSTQYQQHLLEHIPSLKKFVSRWTIDDYLALILFLVAAVAHLSRGKLWDKKNPYEYKLFERPGRELNLKKKDEGSRDIAKQLEKHNKDAVIFWGSQSGTAEGFAHRLARDCTQRFGLDTIVADLSDYDPETIRQVPGSKFVLILISTYGEGDPSDNASDFLTWINNQSHPLTNMRYAAFGLGNSNYVYYNKVVDDLVKRLESLSAVQLMRVGKADDANSGGTEEDFASWRDDLFGMFQCKLGLQERVPEYKPTISITKVLECGGPQPDIGDPQALKMSRKVAQNYSAIKRLPLTKARILTSTRDRSCLHIEVDIRAHPQLKYRTGDHLAVWPTNPAEEVRRLANALNLVEQASSEIVIEAVDVRTELKIPRHTTISALFQHYLEICAPVSRDTVSTLSRLAPSQPVRSFLERLSTKTGYADFISRNHVTLGRLLEYTCTEDATINWHALPLALIIEFLKPMTPRYYSISSSSITSPRQIAITVAVSSTQLASNSEVQIPGLTTSYLSSLDVEAAPSVFSLIRRSNFKMPFLHKTPIILIAAGTGIAPFRGFLQERAQMAQVSNQEIGPILLVFGCRKSTDDYLYRPELEELQRGVLKGKLDIMTAFSREPGQSKCYVQDRLAEPEIQKRIASMLHDEDGNVYFCGSTTMAKTAGRVLVEAVGKHCGLSEKDSRAWMDSMKKTRRWQEDVWG